LRSVALQTQASWRLRGPLSPNVRSCRFRISEFSWANASEAVAFCTSTFALLRPPTSRRLIDGHSAMSTFLKISLAFVGWLADQRAAANRPDVTPGLSFLPGDIKYESPGGNVRVYFPIVTSIVLSVVLTLILRLLPLYAFGGCTRRTLQYLLSPKLLSLRSHCSTLQYSLIELA
jgi:hypothetical protein